jgi:hypothetical protein
LNLRLAGGGGLNPSKSGEKVPFIITECYRLKYL